MPDRVIAGFPDRGLGGNFFFGLDSDIELDMPLTGLKPLVSRECWLTFY